MGNEFEGISDAELWRRASERAGPAFGELFERHADAVYNHCFRQTASWASAEELTSVVFLDAWRRRKEVRLHSDSILPWLLAVANNAIRNANRSRRRHSRLLAKLAPPSNAVDFGDEAAGRIDDERQMANALSALRTLRVEDQETVALCDWAGLSSVEAAAALRVEPGTIRSRLSRAHEYLRHQLPDDSAGYQPVPGRTVDTVEEKP